MRPLSAHDLLKVWEVGEDQSPVDRALTILAAACPELTRDELAELSVGQRDARLLSLRERTSGPRLNCFAECPRCAERLEFDVAVAELRVAAEPDEGPWELIAENFVLRFRLPNSRDLAAVAGCRDQSAARDLLVQRCVCRPAAMVCQSPAASCPPRSSARSRSGWSSVTPRRRCCWTSAARSAPTAGRCSSISPVFSGPSSARRPDGC